MSLLLIVAIFTLSPVYVKANPDHYEVPPHDFIDSRGVPTKGEPCLKIMSVDFTRRSIRSFLIEIVVNGTLPSSIDSSLEFSWHVGFDFHFGNSTKNGWRNPIYWNDIGVDYFVQLGVGDGYWSVLNEQGSAGLRRLSSPYATVKGNKVTFDFSFPSNVNVPTEFSWMVMTRKITGGGALITGLFYADKAPLKGHYVSSFTAITSITSTYSGGNVTNVVTRTIGTQTPTLQMPLGSLNMSTLQQAAGAAATGGAAVFGWFFKTRKRRFVSTYLRKIDSTCSQYKEKAEECKTELSKMKDEILHLLETDKIDEAHFTILDARLTERLRTLN